MKYIILLLLTILYITYSATISGFIRDASDGEAIDEVNVYLEGTKLGAASNVNGYFVISKIPSGNFTLTVRAMGYEVFSEKFSLLNYQSIKREIKLKVAEIEMDVIEISVDADEAADEVMNIRSGQLKLKPRSIKTSTTFIQPDLFRAIQTLPGVVSVSDYSTGLYVRGGNNDHNLILYDEIPVYNPSHLFGVFSTFITDALRDSKLIKSAYPAEYGGRLGAVLDIRSRDGNREKYEGNLSLSLFATEAVVTCPAFNGGFLLAARRSHIDPILSMLGDDYPTYYFWDGQGQLYQDFGVDDRVIFSTYMGSDQLYFDAFNMDLGWGNDTYALRWRHIFSPKVFSVFKLSYSKFSIDMEGFDAFEYVNEVNDISFKNTYEYFVTNQNKIKAGFEVQKFGTMFEQIVADNTLMDINSESYITSLFIESSNSWNSVFTFKPGIRLNYNDDLMEGHKFLVSPRLSLKYMLDVNNSLTLSGGRYYQYLFTVQAEDQSISFVDNWFVIDDTVEPGTSDSFSLGWELTEKIMGNDIKFTVEGYYKYMQNLQNWKEDRATRDDVIEEMIVDSNFVNSNAIAYGIEFMAEKQVGKFNGNISYTYGKVEKSTDDSKVEDSTFDAYWDVPHSFKSSLNYHVNKKLSFGTTITYTSGKPYTENIGYYTEVLESGEEVINAIKGDHNAQRYPDYFRWDVSGNYTWFYKNGTKLLLNVSVLNLTNRENIESYIYKENQDTHVMERDVFPMLPILPSIRLNYSF
ncbi:MAG: TonB-dependent receptor plug domain-containing protein [Candidatus Delongbacteria bacterium]|nr:TonB-dependent receptor plug domain-containing protein [Candidatus Delongbacteria bacterium]